MTLVNHVLCSKEITLPQVAKLIALVLLHFWNRAILEKVENDVPVLSRNNKSEVLSKKDVLG